MRETTLPRRCFNLTDYPRLMAGAVGRRIPIGYGTLTNVVPTEIDTQLHRFKIADHPIAELTAVRSSTGDPMTEGTGYWKSLTLAEFIVFWSVQLTAWTTYYFAVEADYEMNEFDCLQLLRNDNQYVPGTSYAIDGAGIWTADPSDYDLRFTMYGKATLDGAEEIVASNTTTDATAGAGLNDIPARTRIGQSFMPSIACYLTRIVIYIRQVGTPVGNIRFKLYSDTAGSQMGPSGGWKPINSYISLSLPMPDAAAGSDVSCDVKAPATLKDQVADILPDLITSVMGKSASLLDGTELANLAIDRTQDLKVYLRDETTFGDVVGKMETGQLWKLIPLQDGTYGTIVYKDGEPANTPHFRDHDFLSFAMELDSSQLKQEFEVQYNENLSTSFFDSVVASSDVAKFFYMNEESDTVETYLAEAAAAAALADDRKKRYEVPIIRVMFEVHGWALDLLAGRDKVKITHARAAYAGGTLDGVLFRVTKIVKRPETNTAEVWAARWGDATT